MPAAVKPIIPIITVRLIWSEPWEAPPAAHLLRGALAAAFPDNDLFHQHAADGKSIFRYPRIHYRWNPKTGDGIVTGFGDGVESLAQLVMSDMTLQFGDRSLTIQEARAEFACHEVTVLPRLKRYHFRSPWLPLNQGNYERYRNMPHPDRADELDRIAVGNILSALKGFDIRLSERVYAAVIPRRHLTCRYKDRILAGILGSLVTNVDLPDGFALGKAVSHGYGWLARSGPLSVKNT